MAKFGTISRLEIRIYLRFLLVAIGTAVALTAVQYHYDYQQRSEYLESELNRIKDAEIDDFASYIWNPNPVKIRNLIDDTLKTSELTFIRVLREDGEVINEGGEEQSDGRIHGSFPIYFESGDTKVFLGTLILQISTAKIQAQMNSLLALSLAGNFAKVFFVFSTILLILRRYVTKRIQELSRYFDGFDPDCMKTDTELKVLNPSSTRQDEIDVLVMGINKMHKTICTKIDIIQQNTDRLRDEVDSAEWELQQAYDQKANLLRALSHDITNPLTIILGNIQVCQTMVVKGKQVCEKKLGKIKWAAKSIKDMIDHVRIADAIASGKINLELEPVSMAKVMETARMMFEERLETKNIRLEYDVDQMLPIHVKAHFGSLSNQVINNLVSNAIKFSHEGKTITVTAREEGDSMVVEVSDSGIGMPEDMMKVLFDGDSAVSRKGTDGEAGTGFGMLLVKSCMEHFGGKISVSSKPIEEYPDDHGTTFSLTFQRADAPAHLEDKAA